MIKIKRNRHRLANIIRVDKLLFLSKLWNREIRMIARLIVQQIKRTPINLQTLVRWNLRSLEPHSAMLWLKNHNRKFRTMELLHCRARRLMKKRRVNSHQFHFPGRSLMKKCKVFIQIKNQKMKKKRIIITINQNRTRN